PPPFPRRRTDASLFTPTTSADPSRRAASSSATCPTCRRSNTPFVNTTGPPSAARCRQWTASDSDRTFSVALTRLFLIHRDAGLQRPLEQRRGHERRRDHHEQNRAEQPVREDPRRQPDLGKDQPDLAARGHAHSYPAPVDPAPRPRPPARELPDHGDHEQRPPDRQRLMILGHE